MAPPSREQFEQPTADAIPLASLCFTSLGNIFSVPPTYLPSTVYMIALVIKFPVIFISGIIILLDELSSWGRAMAYFSPAIYYTDIARRCFQDRGSLPVALDFRLLSLITILFLITTAKLHRRTIPKRI